MPSNGAGIFFLDLLIQQPTFRRPIGGNPAIVGFLPEAVRHGMGATRMEGAARRQLGEVGGYPEIAQSGSLLPSFGIEPSRARV